MARLAEYGIDELARTSGVSTRNIRAYRERGLLDPPRRVGRAALYDDHHLAQLRIINHLLSQGFNSVHIADFSEGLREGHNLADILGLQVVSQRSPIPFGIDPAGAEARRLVEAGLAHIVGDDVEIADPTIADLVARASNQALCTTMIRRVLETTGHTIEKLAAQALDAVGSVAGDHRDLVSRVVARQFDTALRAQVRAYTRVVAGSPPKR
jgi:DNA-binding transcriptional MerR regulator